MRRDWTHGLELLWQGLPPRALGDGAGLASSAVSESVEAVRASAGRSPDCSRGGGLPSRSGDEASLLMISGLSWVESGAGGRK